MLNKTIKGEITAVKAATEKIKHPDGSKDNLPVHIVKLASAAIDYDEIQKFSPAIGATLLNQQPMPFKSVDFGSMNGLYNLSLDHTEEGWIAEYAKIKIKNITVKVRENIPIYYFTLVISGDQSSKALTDNLKQAVMFTFSEVSK